MAISEAMFAGAVLEFMELHQEEFNKLVFDRYDIADGSAYWGEDSPRKRLQYAIGARGQDGSTLWERTFFLRVESDRPPRQ